MSTNRVNKVLVTTGVQLANMADVDPGQYLVINAASGATLTAASVLEKDDQFQVVVNDPSGAKVFSDKIRIGDITSYQKQDYTAKTEQVITWTPPSPTANYEYSLSIIDKSDKEILQNRQAKRTYTVVAAASGETATTLADKFRTQIAADVAAVVTGSGTSTLILTAKTTASVASGIGEYPAQIVFDIFPSVINPTTYPIPFPTAAGTVAYTTAPAYGSGNFYQVRTREQLSIGYTGVTNRRKFPVPTGNFLSVAGTTYDAVIIEFDNRHDTNVVVEGEKRAPETLEVYITADAGDATIIPILDALALQNAAIYAAIDAVTP